MAKKRDSIAGCSARAFIIVDGVTYLWYEVKFLDDDGKEREVTWHLPKEKTEEYVRRCLENIGRKMSDYIYANPDCSLAKSILNET